VGQVAVAGGCVLLLAACLKTNGTILTPSLEHTRFTVWLLASGVAALTVLTVLGCLYGMYRQTGRGVHMVWLQVVVVLGIAALVIWFAFAIPVPPGTHGAPLFTGD
jgi:hypothetical protein